MTNFGLMESLQAKNLIELPKVFGEEFPKESLN